MNMSRSTGSARRAAKAPDVAVRTMRLPGAGGRDDDHRMGWRRGLVLGVIGVVIGSGLAACGGGRAKPDTAARALADGLSSADLSAVPLGAISMAEAGQQLAAAVKGMGGVRPVVRVENVTKSSDTAVAGLAFTWGPPPAPPGHRA